MRTCLQQRVAQCTGNRQATVSSTKEQWEGIVGRLRLAWMPRPTANAAGAVGILVAAVLGNHLQHNGTRQDISWPSQSEVHKSKEAGRKTEQGASGGQEQRPSIPILRSRAGMGCTQRCAILRRQTQRPGKSSGCGSMNTEASAGRSMCRARLTVKLERSVGKLNARRSRTDETCHAQSHTHSVGEPTCQAERDTAKLRETPRGHEKQPAKRP